MAKPGTIEATSRFSLGEIAKKTATILFFLPVIGIETFVAALIQQAVNGFEKDTLANMVLTRIGSKALADLRTSLK